MIAQKQGFSQEVGAGFRPELGGTGGSTGVETEQFPLKLQGGEGAISLCVLGRTDWLHMWGSGLIGVDQRQFAAGRLAQAWTAPAQKNCTAARR